MIDSADSIIMLYSYAGFPEKSWVIFDRSGTSTLRADVGTAMVNEHVDQEKGEEVTVTVNASPGPAADRVEAVQPSAGAHINMEDRTTSVKMNVMSGLSIVLTLLSILVAYTCVIMICTRVYVSSMN